MRTALRQDRRRVDQRRPDPAEPHRVRCLRFAGLQRRQRHLHDARPSGTARGRLDRHGRHPALSQPERPGRRLSVLPLQQSVGVFSRFRRLGAMRFDGRGRDWRGWGAA